jgi:hypothetical protein
VKNVYRAPITAISDTDPIRGYIPQAPLVDTPNPHARTREEDLNKPMPVKKPAEDIVKHYVYFTDGTRARKHDLIIALFQHGLTISQVAEAMMKFYEPYHKETPVAMKLRFENIASVHRSKERKRARDEAHHEYVIRETKAALVAS